MRRDAIVEIMQGQGYTTVQYLCDTLHFSTATINRDLNLLAKQQILRRSYGGAELITERHVPVPFRTHKARIEKRLIARRAAELADDGDTVFIDASTTAQYMAQYLTQKKNLTVITNNMAVAAYLSEYGVECICLGGQVLESPSMLGGDDTVEAAARYRADKLFFATRGMTADGLVGGSIFTAVHRAMMRGSARKYYLIDHAKFTADCKIVLCTLDEVDCVISDTPFPEELQAQHPETEFLSAGE